VDFVARVDALGAVASVEVDVEFETGDLFDNGKALVLGNTRIDGGFIYDNVAFADDFANGLAGTVERGEVGVVVAVHGGGNGNNVEIALTNVF